MKRQNQGNSNQIDNEWFQIYFCIKMNNFRHFETPLLFLFLERDVLDKEINKIVGKQDFSNVIHVQFYIPL